MSQIDCDRIVSLNHEGLCKVDSREQSRQVSAKVQVHVLDLLLGRLLLHLDGINLCLSLCTDRQINLLKELSNLHLLELVLLTFYLVKHIV